MRYVSGKMSGGGNDLQFVEMASRAGIKIEEGCSNISIINGVNTKRLLDAFVLCTTLNYTPARMHEPLGRYCVQIRKLARFFERFSRKLSKKYALQQCAYGPVIYKPRRFTGLDEAPGPLGFVKPPDAFASQRELRFLWTVKYPEIIKPFLLRVREVASLCKRVA